MGALGFLRNLHLLLYLSVLSVGCIGSNLKYELGKPEVTSPQHISTIAAEVTGSNGEKINLGDYKDTNLVIMFAQFFCEVCKKEAYDLTQSLGAEFKEPRNAKLITIIISSSVEKALAWKQTQKVPWTVASIPNNKLLKNFCPEGLTPCTVIQKPQKGVVFIHQGEVTPVEIISYVGPWQFDSQQTQKKKEPLIYDTKVPKFSTGNPKLDDLLNDPKNICAPSGATGKPHGP
ncbi:MAG: redoxin domain-containing protein [Oligoflexia bacterium]|nr:redoxin domain-containing protein [Oligoflexia bacterium]